MPCRRPWCLLDEEDDRAGEFTAGGNTLHDTQQRQQDRRQDADLLVGGQQAHHRGRDRHQHDRKHQRPAPTEAVADLPEDDAAKRSRQKADSKDRVAVDQPGQRIGVWKEVRRDHRCQHAEQREVIPFEDIADDARRDDTAAGGARVRMIGHATLP
jgi:hypothetical protein